MTRKGSSHWDLSDRWRVPSPRSADAFWAEFARRARALSPSAPLPPYARPPRARGPWAGAVAALAIGLLALWPWWGARTVRARPTPDLSVLSTGQSSVLVWCDDSTSGVIVWLDASGPEMAPAGGGG